MSPRAVRWLLALVCVAGIAGMIVSSIAGSTGGALTCGLVVAVASLGLILVTTVLGPRGFASAAPAVVDDDLAQDVERQVEALVATGADESALRSLVRSAVHLGRFAGAEAVTQPVAIYTALLGGYDRLLEQPPLEGVDFVAFTDEPDVVSQTWDVRPLVDRRPPRRAARWAKTSPHVLLPDHEWTIWVDGRVSIRSDRFVAALLEAAAPTGIAVMAHRQRDCIYDEAREIHRKRFERDPRMLEQIRRYRREGYPAHLGLLSTMCVARRSLDPAIEVLDERWQAEIEAGSARDQLSLPYVLWRLDLEAGVVDLDPYRNELYVLDADNVQRKYPPRWRQRLADLAFQRQISR